MALTQATVACWGATASDPSGAHGPQGSGASAAHGGATGISDGTGVRAIAGGANTVHTGGAGNAGVGPGGATSVRGGASAGGTPMGGAGPAIGGNAGRCPDQQPTKALIDDLESGSGRILGNEGRVGVWYAFNDQTDRTGNTGGTQWPAPTTPGVPIPTSAIDGGRGCSARAMHSYGSGFYDWGAGIGFDLGFDGQAYRTYDASPYAGITFWARGLPETIMQVRIGTAGTTHAEWGGTCPQEPCPFPWHMFLTLNSQWTQYWVPFADLAQATWNGSASFQQNQLTNVQFFVPGPVQVEVSPWPSTGSQTFDFWVDDVAFYTEPAPCCSALPACQGVIGFADAHLEQSVRAAINHPTGDLTCRDACSVYVLSVSTEEFGGIECLANLGVLVANVSPRKGVVDLSPLLDLIRLARLEVDNGDINELEPLAALTNLTTLALDNDRIPDASRLSSLTNLTALKLASNQLTSVGPLATLTNLTNLDLRANQLIDVSSLAALPRLSTVDLTSNPVCCNDPTVTALRQRGVWVNCSSCI